MVQALLCKLNILPTWHVGYAEDGTIHGVVGVAVRMATAGTVPTTDGRLPRGGGPSSSPPVRQAVRPNMGHMHADHECPALGVCPAIPPFPSHQGCCQGVCNGGMVLVGHVTKHSTGFRGSVTPGASIPMRRSASADLTSILPLIVSPAVTDDRGKGPSAAAGGDAPEPSASVCRRAGSFPSSEHPDSKATKVRLVIATRLTARLAEVIQ